MYNICLMTRMLLFCAVRSLLHPVQDVPLSSGFAVYVRLLLWRNLMSSYPGTASILPRDVFTRAYKVYFKPHILRD